jgi:hypothetical protein
MPHDSVNRGVRRIAEVTLVILLLVGGTAVLMPTLRQAREASQKVVFDDYDKQFEEPAATTGYGPSGGERFADGRKYQQPIVRGEVRSFIAKIDLTSRVSIGTSQPESIYEAKFQAEIEALNPDAGDGDAELRLPLPPQLISLSDLNITIAGDPSSSDNIFIEGSDLVWRGRLDSTAPSPIKVTYTAVGKGLYELRMPPGKIIEVFDVTLTANSSDLRMMELSLQPNPPERKAGKTVYHWDYERLMLGRPIRIDILGVAPMDRLGELAWLGPISVLVFGLMVALVAMAFQPETLDKWMLLMILGAFAAAYPLMYYAQDFMSLPMAIVAACAAMMIIIGGRAVTLLGVRIGTLGIMLPGGAVLALIMLATIHPLAQGMLLTVLAIGTLVALMILVPRAQKRIAESRPAPVPAPPLEPKPKPIVESDFDLEIEP